MTVDASGVTTLESTSNLISGFGVDIEFDDGRIYATNGRVIEPETRTIVGTYSVGFGGPVEPDSDHDRVYFVSGGELKVFDLETFVPLPSHAIPGMSGTPASLTNVGEGDLAFRTTADQVFLVRFSAEAGSAPPGSPGDTRIPGLRPDSRAAAR